MSFVTLSLYVFFCGNQVQSLCFKYIRTLPAWVFGLANVVIKGGQVLPPKRAVEIKGFLLLRLRLAETLSLTAMLRC